MKLIVDRLETVLRRRVDMSSTELSTLVSGKAKRKQTKANK